MPDFDFEFNFGKKRRFRNKKKQFPVRPKINLGVAKNVTKTSLSPVTEKNVFESVAIRIVVLFQVNLFPSLKGLGLMLEAWQF